MNFWEVMVIGMVLSADSFSAAIAMGFRRHTIKARILFAFLSGGAEALFTFAGAYTGAKLYSYLKIYNHWIAFIALSGVALHMGYEGLLVLRDSTKSQNKESHGLLTLCTVAVATSMDALAVGFGLGLSAKPLLPFIISIGAWAFISSVLGMYLGKLAPANMGPVFNLLGAIILLVLAVNFLE